MTNSFTTKPDSLSDGEGGGKYFTLVFEGDLREVRGNPHQIKTPYGYPVTVGIGDAFAEFDAFTARMERLEEALGVIADWINRHVPIGTLGATTMLGTARAAIARTETR